MKERVIDICEHKPVGCPAFIPADFMLRSTETVLHEAHQNISLDYGIKFYQAEYKYLILTLLSVGYHVYLYRS
jgi:hypothetical protein